MILCNYSIILNSITACLGDNIRTDISHNCIQPPFPSPKTVIKVPYSLPLTYILKDFLDL